jgi:hypothetical protein
MDRDREGLLLLLLQEGSTHHAVELYREETGVGPEEAKSAVKQLARQHGVQPRRSEFLPLLLAGLAGLLGAVLAFQA